MAAKIERPNPGAAWSGIFLREFSGGDLPEAAKFGANPLFAAGIDGIYRPRSGNPATEAVTNALAKVRFEMDGQPRVEELDTGADEVSVAPVTAWDPDVRR